MPEPIRPTSLPTYGRKNWAIAATIASATLAPATAEMTATSTLDITNMAFASTGKPAQNTNRVTAERRLGDTSQYEQIGTTTYTGGDMTYQFNAQAAALSDGKKMWERIPAGTTGFLVERLGVAKSTAFAAGQFVNVYPVTFGPSQPTEAGDGETAESAAVCSFAVTGPPAFNIAVLA